ncbi:c-type cytochrome [Thiohalomonas denitrificans]|uniref:c-type cytochrome n=1 Tax=Thiohalomonas denitrificans TaxID=415747 RepID=UPI0026EE8501|nr:cytochrome c [Thiohalomonas denitrificans]
MRIALALVVALIASLTVLDWMAPDAESRRESAVMPLESGVGDPGTGAHLFEAECVQCHGADLKGTQEGPPLIHPYYRPDHHADLAFYMAIRDGVVQHHWDFGDMPPVPAIDREQARDIVTFIRQAQREAGMLDDTGSAPAR